MLSCEGGYEATIEDLIQKSDEMLRLSLQVGDALPKEWVDIRKALEKKRSNYISYDNYISLCKKHGLSQVKADFLK